jgi:hypothetical protein
MRGITVGLTVFVSMLSAALVLPDPLSAHCDSMDGPVVTTARRALESKTVELVLVWVLPPDEAEIREAFERTLRVRAAGGEAQELADLGFFETLVRIHRAGEGEPYTGLKPAGSEVPESILAADRALEQESVEELLSHLAGQTASALRERFNRVLDLGNYDRTNVQAGRRYVEAYVEYMHFVEQLFGLVTGEDESHWSEHGAHEP